MSCVNSYAPNLIVRAGRKNVDLDVWPRGMEWVENYEWHYKYMLLHSVMHSGAEEGGGASCSYFYLFLDGVKRVVVIHFAWGVTTAGSAPDKKYN